MVKKRFFAVFLAATMLTGSLCGCTGATNQHGASSDETNNSSGDRHGNEITVGISQDLDNSLDPYATTAAGTREVMFNVFEGLVKPDSDGNFVEAVASNVEISPDGLTYSFTLREGVVFHDGTDCTMEDVLYSFETCADVTVNSNVAAALSAITDTRVEENVVSFTLAEPNSDFLSAVSSVYILPSGYTQQATAPVGTGPFRFVSRSIQENLILERNDAYYGAQAKVERVVFRIFEDSTALFNALDSGTLDMAVHLTMDQVNNLSNGYNVVEGTMNLVQAIYLNHSVAPFDDVRVRQALCYAVDVEAMMELTAEGHGTRVGSSMYPAFGKYFDETQSDAYPHDPEKARQLLAEAGYGNSLSFTIKVPSNYQPHVDTTVVLVEQLKQVGIDAQIQLVDWNTWLEDVYAGGNFQATVVGFDASILSPTAMLARFVSDSGKNFIGMESREYDQVYAQAVATVDDAQQTALFKQCLQLLSQEAANVYLQDLADFVAMRPGLTGYQFYPLYVMDLSTVYFE